jgi:hypothetical protein
MGLFSPNNPAYNAIVIYIIIILLIVLSKPDFMYNHNQHKYKEFGFGSDDNTLLTLPVVGIISALIIFNLFAYIEQISIEE